MTGRARSTLAMFCAFALLVPIISISDDTAASSFDDAAMLAIAVVLAAVLVAIAHVQIVAPPAYAPAIATPSDPRSPPR
jgi:hypothetical protein